MEPARTWALKRPLAVVGFTYLAVLCAAAQLDTGVCLVFTFLCAAGAVLLVLAFGSFRYRAALVAVFCTAGAAFAVYTGVWHLSYEPAAALAGRTAQVSGIVTDAPTISGKNSYYFVRADSIRVDGKKWAGSLTLRVRTTQADIAPFSGVSFTSVLSLPSSTGLDGFNSRQYYRAKGVYLLASPSGVMRVSAPSGFHPYVLAIRLRQFFSAHLQSRVGGVWGALASGILIGDVSNLPGWVKSDFTATGISHILAVSGTQISLIMQVLLVLLARLRLPRRLSSLLTAVAVVGFMAVTGFSPSVNRAGVMALLYLGGLLFGREADALNSLGASVFLLCLLNPFAAMDTGLLLSFAATLGLVVMTGTCVRRLETGLSRLPEAAARILNIPGMALCETVGATLFTLPIILLTFRQLSLATFLSNIIEVPVSLLATLLAAVTALLPDGWAFGWLVNAVALLLRLCCAAMIGYAHVLANLPFASISTAYDFVYPVLAFALAAALLVWRMRGRGADAPAAALCVAFALSVGLVSHAVAVSGVLEFAALPVGSGNCTVLLKGGHAVIVDLDGSEAAYQASHWLKIHNATYVDALVFPNWDAKRRTQLQSLEQDVHVQAVYLPAADRKDALAGSRTVVSQTALDWENILLTLYPSDTGKTLLTTVCYGQARAVLTGGTQADVSAYHISRTALQAQQLFYGGELSDAMIQDVSPCYAVFSGSAAAGTLSGGALGAQGCSVRGVQEQVLLARTRGGAFLPVS